MDGDEGMGAPNGEGRHTPGAAVRGEDGGGPGIDQVEEVDWDALAPDGGKEIPALLRDLADGGAASGNDPVQSLSALYDIVRFPTSGYLAAPEIAKFLVTIACAPETSPAARWRPLSLLLELVVPDPAARLPRRRDLALWRDEVAWVVGTEVRAVREQYGTWLSEASDEQQYRSMANRLDILAQDNGPALLEAELAVYDAVRERVTELRGLLEGAANRRSVDGAAEWACYVLAFFPEEADTLVPAITRASSLLVPKDLAGGNSVGDDPLSAELFALGMLASPEDATVTVALAHQMAAGHLYNTFTAAVALAVIHGEKVPRECVRRVLRSGRSRVGYDGLFGDSWPHCGQRTPEQLGFLALGRGGAATRGVRVDMLPQVLSGAEGDSRTTVLGAALEMVLGPRGEYRDHTDYESADFDEDTLKVLWAIAELSEAAWEDRGVADTLAAWKLPSDRGGFHALVGATDDDEDEDADEGGPEAPSAA
uniref:hypothetical protein n=1 Tax=Allosalinactinospora lopnorensis TaxID=1352348 RepID=UPI000B021DF4